MAGPGHQSQQEVEVFWSVKESGRLWAAPILCVGVKKLSYTPFYLRCQYYSAEPTRSDMDGAAAEGIHEQMWRIWTAGCWQAAAPRSGECGEDFPSYLEQRYIYIVNIIVGR
jgi:hypothetical protein